MEIDVIALVLAPAVAALIGALVAGGYNRVRSSTGDSLKREKAMQDGMKTLMRTLIIEAYEMHVNRERPMTIERKGSIDNAYRVYHALGGNGTITHLYEEIKDRAALEAEC